MGNILFEGGRLRKDWRLRLMRMSTTAYKDHVNRRINDPVMAMGQDNGITLIRINQLKELKWALVQAY